MRVLYVGNLSDDEGSPPHSTENHVKKALRNLGHEVTPVLEKGLDWSTIPEKVKGHDLFLWTRTGSFDPGDRSEQGHIVKSLDVPTVGFHLDRWWGLGREKSEHGPRDPDPTPFFWCDYLFTADGGHDEQWASIGANHHWSPPAILSDEAKRQGHYREDYAYDLAFVGNLRRYAHPEWGPYRYRLYKFLATQYRGRFKLWEGGIRGQDLADLYSSVKVLIGDSCLAGNPVKYFSDRIPETIGRGGFLIHPRVVGVTDGTQYTEGQHLACYALGDFDELRNKIDHYLGLEPDRRDVAAAGRAHVLAHHTYEHRLERIVGIILR